MGAVIRRMAGGLLMLAALLWTAGGFRPAGPDWFGQGGKLAEANGGAWFVAYGDGTLSAWGSGRSGALGDGPRGGEFFRSYGLRETVLTGVQELRGDGGTLILAIDRDGALWSVGAQTTLIRPRPPAGLFAGPDAPVLLMEHVADAAVGPNALAAVGTDGTLYLWEDGGPKPVGTGAARVFFAGGSFFTVQMDGSLLRWDGADSRSVPLPGPAAEVAGAGGGVLILLEDGSCLAAGPGAEGLLSPVPAAEGVAALCRDGLLREDGTLCRAQIADGALTLEPAAENVVSAVTADCCLTGDGTLRTARGEFDLRTAGPVRWAALALAAAVGLPLSAGWRPRAGRAG